MTSEPTLDQAELRRLWDALHDPCHKFWGLVEVLESVQKSCDHKDWREHVNDVMQAMELLDSDSFPDAWYDETDREESNS